MVTLQWDDHFYIIFIKLRLSFPLLGTENSVAGISKTGNDIGLFI